MYFRNAKFVMFLATLFLAPELSAGRLKDLVEIEGVRTNQLFGYGLVVGLSGTGDTEQVLFTSQSMSGMLGRLGVRIDPRDVRVRNVAAVMVTAELPPFARPGGKLDVTVSSIGNARSLAGGVLVATPLQGADGKVYAVGQGAMQVGGFQVNAAGASVRKNTPTTGRIPGGAIVEEGVVPSMEVENLLLSLRSPDFTTASRVAAKINEALGEPLAIALDAAAVRVEMKDKAEGAAVTLMAQLETLEVEVDEAARIVVNERTGTVVVGRNVRIRPVVVAHGGLEVTVQATPVFSQPNPFGNGETAQAVDTDVRAEEKAGKPVAVPAASTVDELVAALSALGVSPRDLISILEAMRRAGALDAELEVL